MEIFIFGGAFVVMGLFHGNVIAVDLWHQKSLAAWEDIDLLSSEDFATWRIGH